MTQPTALKHEIAKLKQQLTAHRRLLRDQEIEAEKKQRHGEIMGILSHHIGRQNAIGMGELYVKVFKKDWKHRINDTRDLRTDIDLMNKLGWKICSTAHKSRGGYYLPASDSEWEIFKNSRIKHHAEGINKFRRIHKITIAEAMRQVQLILEEDDAA